MMVDTIEIMNLGEHAVVRYCGEARVYGSASAYDGGTVHVDRGGVANVQSAGIATVRSFGQVYIMSGGKATVMRQLPRPNGRSFREYPGNSG
jgi:hypothetical protein